MRRFTLLTLLALGPTAVQAEQSLFYLGAGVTNSSLSANITNRPTNFKNDSWKAFAGVRPLSVFAVEADHIDLGSGSRSIMTNTCFCTTHADGSAWVGYAVGVIPLRVADLYAKLGVARWTLKGFYSPIFPNSGNDIAYGIGVQAHFNVVGVRLEYEGVKVNSNEANIASLSVFLNFRTCQTA